MPRSPATIQINTSYTTARIGRQYACNLATALAQEFSNWEVTIIPGAVDGVTLPIEDRVESFRVEWRVRELMTAALTQAVADCQSDRDLS